MISSFEILGSEHELPIPYDPDKGDSSGNNGFIDLVAHPERIDEIHELDGYPELKRLVKFLNSEASKFVSLRVDTIDDYFKNPPFSNSRFSFITISFRNSHPVADREYFVEFYNHFKPFAEKRQLPDSSLARFYIVPLWIPSTGFKGHCLDVRLYGFGNSPKEANRAWVDAMLVFEDYLVKCNDFVEN